MDVRPAPAVARGEYRRETHRAGGVGDLHTPQIVLALAAVQRVFAVAVGVPDVDGNASTGRAAPGQVLERQVDDDRNAFGHTGVRPKAGTDVAADDAGVDQHIGPDGTAPGKGTRGLRWCVRGARGRTGGLGCCRRARWDALLTPDTRRQR